MEHMVRKDREVTDLAEILEIVRHCDVCRLALNGDDGYPYILPLNFGYEVVDGKLVLYFHSAVKGKKHELFQRDNRASFEMDYGHDLFSIESRGYCTMNYSSVIGRGHIEYITDEQEKHRSLVLMTDRYHNGEHFEFNPAAIPRTSCYKLIVDQMVGKRKASKKE